MTQQSLQKAGQRPRTVEYGMQLVLGGLGTVVTVVSVAGMRVQTVGAGTQERALLSINEDGWMKIEHALACELACDWDPAWLNADYYACGDPDELDSTTPEDALYDHFNREPNGMDHAEWIRRVCPLEVTAYQRELVSAAWLSNMAAELVELFEENYALEYGASPDRRPFDDNQHRFRPELIASIRAVLAATVDRAQPYNCTATASKLYSAEEVERILSMECSDWFSDSAAHDTTVTSLNL